nr:MAG TPA: hypothetical protein [Caudoviricetes sp.]
MRPVGDSRGVRQGVFVALLGAVPLGLGGAEFLLSVLLCRPEAVNKVFSGLNAALLVQEAIGYVHAQGLDRLEDANGGSSVGGTVNLRG